ncbi:DUF983 domain-containing protein [Hymenobacter endophyticus]|uniref:DUF983 domain-containing protein n=1 Tax=Hymenobacter endophyticus TaxID=3076335 RepID=A0ABU3TKS1_9BACT|nr:DUF983 domain-containing protein [Hymenobacter endophyticus]MDU0371969.1 DUF983 domain-containing protein [Hymenobacter endophyticus]
MKPIDSSALALLDLRCPRCHQGPLFSYPAYYITKYAMMPDACPVCAQRYEPEPGFYWGAMFVSYAFSVACFVVGGLISYFLLNDPDVWVYMLVVTGFVLATAPAALRYSRAIMLYLFGGIKYDPTYVQRQVASPSASVAVNDAPRS